MRVGILTAQRPFMRRREEGHGVELRDALRASGVEAEIVSMPFGGYAPEAIADQMLACQLVDITASSGVRIDRVIGLDFPAYFMPHPHKILWMRHFPRSLDALGGTEAECLVRNANRALLGRARKIFAQSRRVADRLREFKGAESVPLYRPLPQAARYAWCEAGDFLFVPERVAVSKRQDLVLRALGLTRHAVKAVFAGVAGDDAYGEELRRLSAALGDDRVRFLGDVPEAEKRLLYGRCLGVVGVSADADHGDVALAAMLSVKPVIICTDSGGPLDFVVDGETGVICAPEAPVLAEAMDGLWQHRGRARDWGQAARGHYDALGLGWKNVVERLLT